MPKHWQEYVYDKMYPKCLRDFLRCHRWPTHVKAKLISEGTWTEPELYATIIQDKDGWLERHGLKIGERVKIVMVSRFGDVGITNALQVKYGYKVRTYIENLGNFNGSC